MATNPKASPKDSTARKLIGRFARALLATTCLTVATGGAALAGTINVYTESTDFPSTGPGPSMAAGTTETIINGSTVGGDVDWFEITGVPGSTFQIQASITSGTSSDSIAVFQDPYPPGTSIFSFGDFTNGTPASSSNLNVPGDGDLFIEITRLGGSGEGASGYQVCIDGSAPCQQPVPEPSTIASVGLGLAGVFAVRRKFRKQ